MGHRPTRSYLIQTDARGWIGGLVPETKRLPGSVYAGIADATTGAEADMPRPTIIDGGLQARLGFGSIPTDRYYSAAFQRLEADTSSGYQLLVRITSLDAPAAFAWERQVRLVANWELRRAKSGQSVWKDVISTKFVTTTKDAWGGMERTKLSTEGAARANIRDAVDQLGRLKLE